MSFNRLNYDSGAYKQDLHQSTGPGQYVLRSLRLCKPCYPSAPSIRLQKHGASMDATKSLVDVGSELLGLRHPNSKDPSKNYRPVCPNRVSSSGLITNCNKTLFKMGSNSPCVEPQMRHFEDCQLRTEDTRTSHPPCTLRGTGYDRWDWTCLDPQANIEIPFDWNISNRIVVRDNHRPCIPKPLDQTAALPKGGPLPCELILPTCGAPTTGRKVC